MLVLDSAPSGDDERQMHNHVLDTPNDFRSPPLGARAAAAILRPRQNTFLSEQPLTGQHTPSGLFIRTSRSKRLEETGSDSMYKLPAPNHIFMWSGKHVLDAQGLIYYLGSAGGTRPFVNPAQTGCVRIESCVWKKGAASDVVSVHRDMQVDSWSEDIRDAWFQVELPEGIQISPRHYTLRHGHRSGARLRNWVLLTSMDGDHWVVASHHKNDESLKGAYAVHTWEITTHIEVTRQRERQTDRQTETHTHTHTHIHRAHMQYTHGKSLPTSR